MAYFATFFHYSQHLSHHNLSLSSRFYPDHRSVSTRIPALSIMSIPLNPWYRLTCLSYLQSAVSNAIEKLAEQREWSDRVKDSCTLDTEYLAAEYCAASLEADAAYRRVLAEIDSMKERCGR